MIRVGQIVKDHANPLMLVSPSYEDVVTRLAGRTYNEPQLELLACMVVSQTEEQYKRYMVLVLKDLASIEQAASKLVLAWQQNQLDFHDQAFQHLLSDLERELLRPLAFEASLNDHPELFADGFELAFYPTMKKAMVYWRRLAREHMRQYAQLSSYQKLVLHFITAQMLVSWEGSCIDLGLMLLDDWPLADIEERYPKVWPVYFVDR